MLSQQLMLVRATLVLRFAQKSLDQVPQTADKSLLQTPLYPSGFKRTIAMSEKKDKLPQKSRSHRACWAKLSIAALALAVPSLFIYTNPHALDGIYETLHTAVSSYVPTGSPIIDSPALEEYSVQYLDIDENEYRRLGLTPNKPVQIVPLGNKHRPKTLHGRFLHITDIHPDEFYTEGASIDIACHRGKPEKGQPGASKYGDAVLGCDSPMILMNETMQWIAQNLKDKIDFVIWTGDNIRHDNDRKIPRTEMAILDMNQRVANIFHDLFHGGDEMDPRHYDVPVIPSLGNNDVYPHNLFAPGPTLQTREMWQIWQEFVPQEQMHIFERGVYFFNEVIPNKLAVLSINTLYLYKANPLVDSCDRKKDPGYQLLKWLGITLQELRDRNMKVWLSGHVPPIPKNYDISCFRKFAIWTHEYRDIIIGGVYGHMNVDHFIPVDAQKAYRSLQSSLISQGYKIDENFAQIFDADDDLDLETQYLNMGFNVSEHDLNVAIASKEARAMGGPPTNKEMYIETVRETFYADIKSAKKSGVNYDRYSITNIAASVIPTFNPGMRIWEYNITGIEESFAFQPKPWTDFFKDLDSKIFTPSDVDDDDLNDDFDELFREAKKKKGGKKKKNKKDPSLPKPMPSGSPLGPGYTPQLFSPTRFVQYYLDLAAVNDGSKKFEYEVEYTSDGDPYNMESLLVEDFVKLGRKLGEPVRVGKKDFENEEEDDYESDVEVKGGKKRSKKLNKLWETYKKHAFVSSGYTDPDDK